jgi:predicted acyltransferase
MSTSLSQRFTALDVFRGMTICFMIIVNTPGGDPTFSPLHHAAWNGFTPTDLVFPSFMFAVGNAMSFVMKKWAGLPTSQVVGKILKRTFIIFLLGYLMYWFPFFTKDAAGNWALSPFSDTRIFGVLQRIALAYGAAGLMIYFFGARASTIISIIILILYWPVMYYFGTGPDPLDIHTNAALRFDTWLIGERHMYHGEGFAFEPEGVLSTFPSIANVVAGYLVGRYVQRKGNSFEGLAKLCLAGFLCLMIAYWWNLGFPINKKLWTSSFVLHTVGLDCLILACIMYWTDFKHHTAGTYFFKVFGRNPLPIYLLSELLVTTIYVIHVGDMPLYRWLYQNIFAHAGDYIGSLMFALTYMLFCWTVGYVLDRNKVYIRV